MKMTLYVQRNKTGKEIKSPKGIEVDFNFDHNGEAMRFSLNDQRLVARLIRARLNTASANGMSISGLEKSGFDRNSEILRHQEWWLCPLK